MMMPELDGLEVLEKLRSQRELDGLKVIIISGKAYEFDRKRALDFGADGYITKPVDHAHFISKVKSIMADKVLIGFWGVRGTLPVPGDRETYEEYRDLWFGTKRFEELSNEVRKQLESMAEAEVNDYQKQLLEFIKEDVAYPQDPGGAPHRKNLIDKALAAGGHLKQGEAAQLLLKVFGSGDDS